VYIEPAEDSERANIATVPPTASIARVPSR
jgi:hypothetical protein